MGKAAKKSGRMLLYPSFFLRCSSFPKKAFFYLFHRCPSTYLPFLSFSPFSASFCLLHFSSSLFSSLTLHGDNEATSLPLLLLPVEAVALSPLMPKGERKEKAFFSRTPPLLTPFGTERGSFGGERGGGARMVVGALTYVRCTTVCSTSVEPPPLFPLVTSYSSLRPCPIS